MSQNQVVDKNVTEIVPMLTLPAEIRGQIFNLLPSKDATTCRLVCNQFKAEVDEFVEFSADLDETQGNENGWYLPRILNLRLREVAVKSLVGPPCLFGHVGTQLLRYPHLLRRLRVVNSKISVENLHYLLLDSATTLRHLDLNLAPPVTTSPTELGLSPDKFSYKFKNVTHLSLSISTVPSATEEAVHFVEAQVMRGPPMAIQEDAIPILLLSSKFDCIRNLRVQIRCCLGFRQASQLSALVLRLVSKSYQSLKSFDLDLIQGHGLPVSEEKPLADSDMEKIDIATLNRVTALENIRIINSTAVGITLWQNVLANQKKLKCMETDILPAPAALFRQIILNNKLTLTEVDIGDLTLDIDEETGKILPFDMAIFANCLHLTKLTLDRNSLTRRRGPVQEAELIQLSHLPEKVTELNINYFLVPSDELMSLFNPTRGLILISLTQCGDSGPFGVHGSVLQKIITLPTIQFIEISPLNYSVDVTESQKLDLILTTFGYPKKHSYFQLRRVDASTPDKDSKVDLDDLEFQ